MLLSEETARELLKRHELGFYVCNLTRFRNNLTSFLSAFRSHYPNTHLGYSYKTNYLPALCLIVESQGQLAEVVSGREYQLARRLGVPGERIIFNGPIKLEAELARASSDGALVNVDSWNEIDALTALSMQKPDFRFRAGLRCAIAFEGQTPSRFGFGGEDVYSAAARLRAIDGVALEGLHCHVIPPQRSPGSYRDLASRLIGIADRLWPRDTPGFLDLGGGFYSPMPESFKRRFPDPIPDYDDYAVAITEALLKRYGSNGPQLILEPGLAVVADVFEFYCSVREIKQIEGRDMALVGGSVYNTMPTKSKRNPPLSRCGSPQAKHFSSLDIVGYTCMEDDVLFRGYSGPLARDDVLAFANTGAYTTVLKPPFIQSAPPILALDEEEGRLRPLREAESLDAWLDGYREGAAPR